MLTAAVLWCLQSSQARIDVREPAAVGSVMAERLGKAFGVKIYAGEGIADVPLIFAVKGVTFDEFRPLAAEGLDASWRQVRDGWELYRTKQQTNAEERRMFDRRAALIHKAFSELQKEPSLPQHDLEELALNIKLANDDDLFDLVFGSEVVTDQSLIFDVWTELGASYFVDLPIDVRRVYSSDGRNGTKKLPVLADVARRLSRENERVVAALKTSGAWQRLESSADFLTPEECLSLMDVGSAQTLLLEVSSTRYMISISLRGYDAKGAWSMSYSDVLDLYEPERSRIADTITDKKIELDPEIMDVRRAVTSALDLDEHQSDGALVDFLVGMPEKDYLSYDVSTVLFEMAATLDGPLVGRLTEDFYDRLGLYSHPDRIEKAGGMVSLRSCARWLDIELHFVLSADGLLVVRPEVPVRYQMVAPRTAVSEYVRSNHGKSLLDLTRIAGLLESPFSIDAEENFEIALMTQTDSDAIRDVDLTIAATWASLTPVLKSQAMAPGGATLPFSRCSSAFRREFMHSAVYYGLWSMLVGSKEEGSDARPLDFAEESFSDVILFDVGPDTFNDLMVNVRTYRSPKVLTYLSDEDEPLIVSAKELARWVHALESEGEEADLKGLMAAEFGLEDFLNIEVRYPTPVGTMLGKTSVQLTDSRKHDLTFDRLPAPFLDEFRRTLAELRKGGGQPAPR